MRPKHTNCNTTADIGITIYIEESNRFDLKTFDNVTAQKISHDVARHRTLYDFTMKGYENMRHDIDLNYKEELIDMYDCKYAFVPDDDYFELNLRGISGQKLNKMTHVFEYF